MKKTLMVIAALFCLVAYCEEKIPDGFCGIYFGQHLFNVKNRVPIKDRTIFSGETEYCFEPKEKFGKFTEYYFQTQYPTPFIDEISMVATFDNTKDAREYREYVESMFLTRYDMKFKESVASFIANKDDIYMLTSLDQSYFDGTVKVLLLIKCKKEFGDRFEQKKNVDNSSLKVFENNK